MQGLNFPRSCSLLTAFAIVSWGGAAPALAQQRASTQDLDAIIDTAQNPDSALQLAREQVDTGDLIGAAATLERTLLARPDAAASAVRLYYVATLCRLDDRARAQIELARIGSAQINDADWAATVQACGAIDRPTSGASPARAVTGQFAVGAAYDTDALGALAVTFDFPGITGVSDDDFSFIASGEIDGRLPIGQSYLYGALAGETKNSLGNSRLDYQIGTVRGGYGRQTDSVGFSFGGIAHHARLRGDPFVTEYGGQAQIALPTGRTGRISLRGEALHQAYAGSSTRDGERYDVAIDYEATTRNQAQWVVGAAFEEKTADTSFLGYRGGRVYAAFRQPIGSGGNYGAVSSTIRFVDFRDAMFVTDRQETRYFTRAALGTPVFAKDFDLEAGLSHTRRDYNRSSFLRDYDSVGVDLQLIWSFGK